MILRIYKEFLKINNKKIKNNLEKWAKDGNRQFTEGNLIIQVPEGMLNGNGNHRKEKLKPK